MEAAVNDLMNRSNVANPSTALHCINSKSFTSNNENSEDDYPGSLSGNLEPWFVNTLNDLMESKWIKEVKKPIPNGILPCECRGVLRDISVKVRGPDERAYSKNHRMRKYIPRGLTIIHICGEDFEPISDAVIYANKKFYGNTLEDEDVDCFEREEPANSEEMKNYFLSNCENASKIVATEKINGEAAHFSGRFINGKFYLIAGSKNVHLIFRSRDHISLYSEDRYRIAREIAYAVHKLFKSLSPENQRYLANFLHITKTTVVCEIMLPSHQHIVHFNGLTEAALVVIALTLPPQREPVSLTALPSEYTYQFFGNLGFVTTKYETLYCSDWQNHIKKTRKMLKTEGVVYYFEDFNQNTTGLVKVKSCWYIHLRALRQQAAYRYAHRKSSALGRSLSLCKERSRLRMQELQTWLETSDDELETWQKLSDYWFDYLHENISRRSIDPQDIVVNFPFVWRPFVEEVKNRTSNDAYRVLEQLNLT